MMNRNSDKMIKLKVYLEKQLSHVYTYKYYKADQCLQYFYSTSVVFDLKKKIKNQ